LHYLLRQAGLGHGDPVLHLDRSDIRVRTGLEGQGDGHRPVAARSGIEIEQIIDRRQLLFDDRGDGLFQDLGTGARIAGGDTDLGRCNRRICRYWQIKNSDGPRQGNQDRDNPSEDGPIDEKSRHRLLLSV